MHLRSLLRSAATAAAKQTLKSSNLSVLLIPTAPKISPLSPPSFFYSSKSSSKSSSSSKAKGKTKTKSKDKDKSKKDSSPAKDEGAAFVSANEELDADDSDQEDLSKVLGPTPADNKSLDIGPKGLPLFTKARSISELVRKDVCSYMDFSLDDLIAVLAEGLPAGMKQEFKETRRSALLVRQGFLDLRDNFRRVLDPPPLRADSKGK